MTVLGRNFGYVKRLWSGGGGGEGVMRSLHQEGCVWPTGSLLLHNSDTNETKLVQ